jgi:hypothetical protein
LSATSAGASSSCPGATISATKLKITLLTQTSADGTVDSSDYCVKGNTLTVSDHGSGMMGQAVLTGTITATKQ